MSASSSARQRGRDSRPQSAASRAWSGGARSNQGYEDDVDDLPTAMESEMYVDGTVQVAQPQKKQAGTQEAPVGCWDKFKLGIRSLWATRQTEATKEDPELHVKTTLRELILYIIFLIILCVLTFGMTSSTMYYYTSVMSGLFLDTVIPGTTNSFRTLTNKADFFTFMENNLMEGLYWEKWYNNNTLPEDDRGYIFYENRMLGVPRLRQLKVKDDSCTVASELQTEIPKCYSVYSGSREEKATFGNTTAFEYSDSSTLDGGSHWGLISRYGGGGYVQNLGANSTETLQIIKELKEGLWVDRGTRVVFIDFTVYNANINLFCVVRLLAEMPATGGIIPSWSFRTVKLIRYVSTGDYFVMACECLFILFIIYYTIEEVLEIKRHKLRYFKSFWNVLDILVIFISAICITFNIYRTIAVNDKLSHLLEQPDQFSDFEFLSYWQMAFNNAVAVTVFFAWIKIFKYISFNKTMTQLSSTLGRCAKDIAGFAVMFFIVFFAFAQLGNLMFGSLVKDFRTFGDACFTLFRIVLGDFNYYELEAANRVLGPAYFFLYVFFVFFVLLNMFLAIINDTYSEVKSELANEKNEFEMGDYFKKGYHKMMEKMSFKRDKIIDIQKALTTADINDDKIVDFDEWRQQLKMRGYADGEIEAIFSKYDADGDRRLDEGEQIRMREDLEGAKQAINKDLDNGDTDYPADGDGADMQGAGVARPRGVGAGGVSLEEFQVLARRVDRMENSIGSIVSKIDAVLVKLEAMEKNKMKRREAMSKILSSISESNESEEAKRERMERLVRDELERWDATPTRVTPDLRGVSPDSHA